MSTTSSSAHRPGIMMERARPPATTVEALKRAILDNLLYLQGKYPAIATKNDFYMAVARTTRDRLVCPWMSTLQTAFGEPGIKVVGYLSAEFLVGPHLSNALVNLGLLDAMREAMGELGLEYDDIAAQEEEPGLGNGGLGRLAACYLDSLASVDLPAIGYGIRYEFGIFDQEIRDGWQHEITDRWLRFGNPWEIERPEATQAVMFGGKTESYADEKGRYRVRWNPHLVVNGIPSDTPIPGYRTNTTSTLRLWKAGAPESFDFAAFNVGDYDRAVEAKVVTENITKVLYPNDEPAAGKQLRLEQQYFFVSCSLQDLIRLHTRYAGLPLERFGDKIALQLNDTHPAVAVAELMRLLVDEHGFEWDDAWAITQKTFAYTNHTLLPEALERWPIALFGALLPRPLEIIYEINRRFLAEVAEKFPGDVDKVRRMSLIDENGERYVRMAHLACVGSHAINGVAALHTQLLKDTVLRDFYDLWPEKFSNKTNGVTPRRWMVVANPRLSSLITRGIGEAWIKDASELRKLESLAGDAGFRHEWREVKQANKRRLAALLEARAGVRVDPESLFGVQVKRIHEYKRQHLAALYIVATYARLLRGGKGLPVPRTFVFGGKAAPGYFMAKLIIKLINNVAEVVNGEPKLGGALKVAFLPDFNVTLGQIVYPAANLSEQISLAGTEASGTGNMKFAMNGALTIGTLDGANVEIREQVGAENFFHFGMTADEVVALRASGYRPRSVYEENETLREAVDLVASGHFSGGDKRLFAPLVTSLLEHDPYMVLADFQAYAACQELVNARYREPDDWTRRAILNVARIGKFSSDRAIREYASGIWGVAPVHVELDPRAR